MRNKYIAEHVMKRDDMFYYVRHIPRDLSEHYRVKRLCFSLKTKSLAYADRIAKSVSQRQKTTGSVFVLKGWMFLP